MANGGAILDLSLSYLRRRPFPIRVRRFSLCTTQSHF